MNLLILLIAISFSVVSSAPTQDPVQRCASNLRACSQDFCCSHAGECGRTAKYCSTGCQPKWGKCWPSTNISVQSAATIEVVTSCTTPGTIAITFDDGPYIYTKEVADAFSQAGAHVTFFMNGLNWACIYDYADVVRSIFDAGHQIGSHTWSHPDLTTLSDQKVALQMNLLSKAFYTIFAAIPVYMRPPYGRYNSNTLGVLESLGFRVVAIWDLDPGDTTGATVEQEMQAYFSATTTPHIALQHDTVYTTAKLMVPFIIEWAKSKNLKMVTLGECLGDPEKNWYITQPPLGFPSSKSDNCVPRSQK